MPGRRLRAPSSEPMMHLDGKGQVKGAKVGQKVKMIVEGTIDHVSESLFDGKKSSSQSLRISKMREMPKTKKGKKK